MKLGVVIIGDSSERALAERIASDTGAMNLAGELSVLETAAVLSRCALLVTNDSAPLHLAEAVGTPVIAIFGPTVREFGFYPSLEESIVLEKDVACRPCSRNGSAECTRQVRECLESITADDVIEAAGKILAGSGSNT